MRRTTTLAVSSILFLSVVQVPGIATAEPAPAVAEAAAPGIPKVTATVYAEDQTAGWNPATRSHSVGWFYFAPGDSTDVAAYRYEFSDGTTGTVEARLFDSALIRWRPRTFGPHDLQVRAVDAAGVAGEPRRYAFTVARPPRDVRWNMDETSGSVAAALGTADAPRPDADLVLHGDPTRGAQGDREWLPEDRSVTYNGVDQYGEIPPAVRPGARRPTSLVDTGKTFMFATWVRLDSTTGDQVALSQTAADGSVFELGWLDGRWTFRHREADGTVLATVHRTAGEVPWTEHWVSLMAGYDPADKQIWLRTQAEGKVKVCPDPDAPWSCETRQVLAPQTGTAADVWTPRPGTGPLIFAATATTAGKGHYWSGRIDDTQLWPLTDGDESILRAIYGEE